MILCAALAAAALGWFLKPNPPSPPLPPPAPVIHSQLVLPGAGLSFLGISPNGRFLAFDRNDDARGVFYLGRLDAGELDRYDAIKDSWAIFFKPDGESLAYTTEIGEVWRMDLDGSKPVPVSESSFSGNRDVPGGSWSESGVIVFAAGGFGRLMQVPSVGGQAEPLTELKEGEMRHGWPQCLPGGTHVLFTIISKYDSSGEYGPKAAIADLVTGKHQILPLEDDCDYVRYAGSGHLLYVKKGILFAGPFDLGSMSITGSKKDVMRDIAMGSDGLAHYDISTNGTLVYQASTLAQTPERSYTLKWLLRDGT
jgi:serine/threonine-protein kinase